MQKYNILELFYKHFYNKSTIEIFSLEWLYCLYTQVTLYNIFTHSNTILTVIGLLLNIYYLSILLRTWLMHTIICILSFLLTDDKRIHVCTIMGLDYSSIPKKTGDYSACLFVLNTRFSYWSSKDPSLQIISSHSIYKWCDRWLITCIDQFIFNHEQWLYKHLRKYITHKEDVFWFGGNFILTPYVYILNVYLYLFNFLCAIILLEYNNPLYDYGGMIDEFNWFDHDTLPLIFTYNDVIFYIVKVHLITIN